MNPKYSSPGWSLDILIVDAANSQKNNSRLSFVQQLLAYGAANSMITSLGVNMVNGVVFTRFDQLKQEGHLRPDGSLNYTLEALQTARLNELKGTFLGDYFYFLIHKGVPVIDVAHPSEEQRNNGIIFRYVFTELTGDGDYISSYRSGWHTISKQQYNEPRAQVEGAIQKCIA